MLSDSIHLESDCSTRDSSLRRVSIVHGNCANVWDLLIRVEKIQMALVSTLRFYARGYRFKSSGDPLNGVLFHVFLPSDRSSEKSADRIRLHLVQEHVSMYTYITRIVNTISVDQNLSISDTDYT